MHTVINQYETIKLVKRKTFNGFVFMQNYIGFLVDFFSSTFYFLGNLCLGMHKSLLKKTITNVCLQKFRQIAFDLPWTFILSTFEF